MNLALLRPEVQGFIEKNIGVNISKLALQKNPFSEIPWTDVLNQIAGKSKAQTKLPTWATHPGIIYPAKISVEQASSELAAQYKAGLVNGGSLADLTGGLGVDSYYFSKNFDEVIHCEIDPELSQIVKHNSAELGISNIEFFIGDSLEMLQKKNRKWDIIYIDPSRRSTSKGKVFLLQDCLPDVVSNLQLYFKYTDQILIKTSPMLDLASGLSEIQNVAAIHVLAINNEVKELLWILRKDFKESTNICCVNIAGGLTEEFSFDYPPQPSHFFSPPLTYLYEPNAAIMKAGGFDEIPNQLDLPKLHKHSHLYTSDNLIPFPGRTFRIINVLNYSKTDMKTLSGTKANVTTRNFPDSVEAIRKKWKISDGGSVYSFFTTIESDQKIVLICEKIN